MESIFVNYGVVGMLALTCIKLFLDLNNERKMLLKELEDSRNAYIKSLSSITVNLQSINDRLGCIEKKMI